MTIRFGLLGAVPATFRSLGRLQPNHPSELRSVLSQSNNRWSRVPRQSLESATLHFREPVPGRNPILLATPVAHRSCPPERRVRSTRSRESTPSRQTMTTSTGVAASVWVRTSNLAQTRMHFIKLRRPSSPAENFSRGFQPAGQPTRRVAGDRPGFPESRSRWQVAGDRLTKTVRPQIPVVADREPEPEPLRTNN